MTDSERREELLRVATALCASGRTPAQALNQARELMAAVDAECGNAPRTAEQVELRESEQ